MNINMYPEIYPGKKPLKRIYIAVMLWIVGRGIQAASRIDRDVKLEFRELPEDFLMCLGVLPDGPYMFLGRDKKGRARYMGWNPRGKKVTLGMSIKNIEAAILVFTFRESTATAFAHDRFIVDGDLIPGMAVVRILNIIEVYLLPKIITKLAVKRYPKWSEMNPIRKHVNRILVYLRAFTF